MFRCGRRDLRQNYIIRARISAAYLFLRFFSFNFSYRKTHKNVREESNRIRTRIYYGQARPLSIVTEERRDMRSEGRGA